MNAYFKGQPVFGPRGPAGPDGSPIGTIISYLGLTAPDDYLICDGAVYNIADYSRLARFFREQFGSENYFGGDGEKTFAVPDMRNLFLRGYHGEAEEQLSGGIGQKQEATQHINIKNTHDHIVISQSENKVISTINPDTAAMAVQTQDVYNRAYYETYDIAPHYTSRPVNMAVLYCIKATISDPCEDIYSTEETRIGRWIDGRPLYRRSWEFTTAPSTGSAVIPNSFIPELLNVCRIYGAIYLPASKIWANVPYITNDAMLMVAYNTASGFYSYNTFQVYTSVTGIITAEYTKTTDQDKE